MRSGSFSAVLVLAALAITSVAATGNIGEIYNQQHDQSPIKDLNRVEHTGTPAESAKDVWQYNCAKALKAKGGLPATNHYRRNKSHENLGWAVCVLDTPGPNDSLAARQSIADEVLKSLGWKFADS